MTSLLELALWKARIDDSLDDGKTIGGGTKKMKMDESEFRLQCRISCGADAVIKNELPYLLPPYFELSYVDEDSSDDDDDEEDDDAESDNDEEVDVDNYYGDDVEEENE